MKKINKYLEVQGTNIKDQKMSVAYDPYTKELIVSGFAKGYWGSGTDAAVEFEEWLQDDEGLLSFPEVSRVQDRVKMQKFNFLRDNMNDYKP